MYFDVVTIKKMDEEATHKKTCIFQFISYNDLVLNSEKKFKLRLIEQVEKKGQYL